MQEVFEKIIEKLEELNPIDYEESNAVRKCLSDVKEIVKQATADYSNGWIPCTDRLPNPEEYQRGNGRFLVTDGNRTYEAEFDIYESRTFGKSRMATDWFVTDKCVTHWQNEPLPPEPYQPKGE